MSEVYDDVAMKRDLEAGFNPDTVFRGVQYWLGKKKEALSLKNGVSTSKKELFDLKEEKPLESIKKAFLILHKYGVSEDLIQEWVKVNAHGRLLYDILDDVETWKKLGINSSKYVDRFLDERGEHYLEYCKISKLPKAVSVQAFVDYYTMEEILEATDCYGFDSFIREYRKAGGDPGDLVAKFEDEIEETDDHRIEYYDLLAAVKNVDDDDVTSI